MRIVNWKLCLISLLGKATIVLGRSTIIVFPVRYSKALQDSDVTDIMQKTASGIAQRYATKIEAIACDKDHINPLCDSQPKVAQGDIVRIVKGITADRIVRHKPLLKKELWAGEFWIHFYYVANVRERANRDTPEKYIEKQGKPETEFTWFKLAIQGHSLRGSS